MQGLGEFFHMGGYAMYVWPAFGISIFTLLIGFILPLFNERRILDRIRKRNIRREERSESATT